MLRSVESSIEFEKFRRNWSEKNNSASRFYGRSTGREPILAMKFASCDDDHRESLH
ncbi:hypothetical protein [Leptospira noguchii]|uniref:Uncharacterized protein n=1 Tax=Leptospira noguchii TaxID=28182 RepID=A0AAE9GGG3_9LEPT|nr:hypothetical protein [Leptospira noguchii]UOG57086.1 hypothetical protein MAL03_02445 [Leptospira noguchii]